jgi:hypothetical protein
MPRIKSGFDPVIPWRIGIIIPILQVSNNDAKIAKTIAEIAR